MAIRGGYYNSISGDRRYNAEEMSSYFKGLYTRGVLQNYGGKFVVRANTGMKVVVSTGKAYFPDGKWIENTSDLVLTLSPADVILNRIDSIVLVNNKNESMRKPDIIVKKGVPATNPVEPGISGADPNVEELLIANVKVPKLTETITQSNITNTIPNTTVCGYVTGLIEQVDTEDLYMQYESAYKEFREKSQKEFDTWFKNVKETLSTATLVREYTRTHTATANGEKKINIGIPQYTSVLDILEVYVNGFRLNNKQFTIDGFQTITLAKGVDIGTEIEIVVYKSVDGSEAETVIKQVEDLQTKVAGIEKAEKRYKCTGTDDNKRLSELAQNFLLARGEYAGIGANAEMLVKVSGVMGITSTFDGSGSADYPFCWLALGKYNNKNTGLNSLNSERKITFDFTDCDRISVGSNAGQRTVLVAGDEVNVIGLKAVLGGGGSTLNWFNGKNIRVRDAMLYMNATSIAVGSVSGGTFEYCRLSVTSTGGKANALVSDGTTPLKAIDCYIVAYSGSGTTEESVCVLAEASKTASVVIVDRCNMPLISRGGYKQSQTIKINSGYCSLTSNILGKASAKYSSDNVKCTEIGTMIISKQE